MLDIISNKIVDKLIEDINDRAGIKHEWRQIDCSVIENEIIPAWKSYIKETLEPFTSVHIVDYKLPDEFVLKRKDG
jgi:hypothetical protein